MTRPPTSGSGPLPALPVVVVGGGIAGLASAYELSRRGIGVIVLEAGPRAGGVILTERVDEFLIDAGPDSLLAQKPAAIELARELGIGDRLQTTLVPRTAFIMRRGRLHPMPEASVMGIPTRMRPFATTGLFSVTGKLRMLGDVALPRRAGADDESIASFMRRRFGEEAVQFLAEPLLAGIHSGDAEKLSMRALFPRLLEAEQKSRSLILGFRRLHARTPPGGGDGMFRSLPGGVGELSTTVEAALPAGTVRTGAAVCAVEPTDAGWSVALRDGTHVPASAVVLATPAYVTADIVGGLDAALAGLCGDIPYASSVTVALAYRRSQVHHPLAGSGFVVPRAERDVRLMACSWVSSKWPGRAPEGFALLRAFLGGARNPELLDREDHELGELAHAELARLLGIEGRPVLVRPYRWMRANAQHEVGHLARLQAIERRLARHPGLLLTGSAFRGTGVTDCVADGRAVAAALAVRLGKTNVT
jgi:oxygen-dependent protoporphyrinogen oxidase